jgi:hypothetical protein
VVLDVARMLGCLLSLGLSTTQLSRVSWMRQPVYDRRVYNPIRNITFDAHDPHALAAFWAQVSGFTLHPETEPDDEEVLLQGPEGSPRLLFIKVPEGKQVKNRVHLDVQQETGTRDGEVDRLRGLGATVHEDHRNDDGTGWVTMLDTEGNEFCVERSAAERA